MGIDWTHQLAEQLDRRWRRQLRPRYDGLTDAEYFWEPVANTWNIRPRGHGRAAITAGGGDFIIDYAYPEPTPAPVTTIAWRLAHLIVSVFGTRVADHFGGPPVDDLAFNYAGTAAQALRQLDDVYAAWLASVKSLGEAGLARPCGPAEGPLAEYPMATLVLHINREALHHGARSPCCATCTPTAYRSRADPPAGLAAALTPAQPAVIVLQPGSRPSSGMCVRCHVWLPCINMHTVHMPLGLSRRPGAGP